MKITQRKDGRFFTRKQVNGEIKNIYGKSEAEVEAKLKTYERSLVRGEVGNTKKKVGEYILWWLETFKKRKMKKQSYTRLRSTIINNIIPNIGHYKMCDLNATIIQTSLIDRMNDEGYSKSSIKKAKEALNVCLRYASDPSIRNIPFNPMSLVDLPVEYTKVERTKKEMRIALEDIHKIENAIKLKYSNGKYIFRNGYAVLLVLFTGMRAGEALALTWDDYDEVNHTLNINKTIIVEHNDAAEIKYKTVIQNSAKTKTSERTISLNNQAINAINELKKISRGNYIIDTNKGGLIPLSNFERNFQKLLKKAEVKKHHTLHDLRHTYASLLRQADVDIEVISEILGHKRVDLTIDKYITTTDEDIIKAMKLNIY